MLIDGESVKWKVYTNYNHPIVILFFAVTIPRLPSKKAQWIGNWFFVEKHPKKLPIITTLRIAIERTLFQIKRDKLDSIEPSILITARTHPYPER